MCIEFRPVERSLYVVGLFDERFKLQFMDVFKQSFKCRKAGLYGDIQKTTCRWVD